MSLKPASAVKRMLKWTLWAASSSFLVIPCAANPLLWKVEADPPGFLFGTIHSDHPGVADLPPPVWNSLGKSRSFHPEISFSPDNLLLMASAMFDFTGPDLDSQLPEDLWPRLKDAAARLGINELLLRKTPLPLAPLLFANPPGTNPEKIMDFQLYAKATQLGLSITPLETPNEQLAVFRNLKPEQSVLLLREALEEWENNFPSKGKLVALYREGDPDKLLAHVMAEFSRSELKGLEEALLHRRNEKMAARVLPHLREGGAFIAVGAAHLAGERGLVELLRKEGFQLERIP